MADEELEIEEGGKKKGKMMIIIIVVVLLAGGGAAAFFLMGGEEPPEEGAELAPEASGQPVTNGLALYVAMPRPFQFNAPGVARERLVQIEVQLMVRGEENQIRAQRHIPMIEGTILNIFSAANADELVTEIGKTELRDKATSQVQQVMQELENNPVVEQVLFTGFVIQ